MLTRSARTDERQQSKARLDAIFRRKVKERDGYTCQDCGSHTDVQCAHFFPRARLSTRWRLDCAATLCDRCHRHFTKHPDEWTAWLIERLGEKRFRALQALSMRVKSVDLTDLRQELGA